MSDKVYPSYLQLVENTGGIGIETRIQEWVSGTQQTLFPMPKENLIAFINTENISRYELVSVLENTLPKYIYDLRDVPLFDFGSLNRKRFFNILNEMRIRYMDFAGPYDEKMSGLSNSWAMRKADFNGPVLILINDAIDTDRCINNSIEALDGIDWEVFH